MKKNLDKVNRFKQSKMIPRPCSGENGSIIVVVMLVLVLLTLGGITATNLSVTESFIVRNTAIHKQNLQMAENAALEGLREILNRTWAQDLVPGGAGAEVWFRDVNTWDNDPTVDDPANDNNFPLTDNNSAVAASAIIDQRDETADTPLRYYFIGWQGAPGSSMVMTGPRWWQGRVISVYNSDTEGLASVEVGVLKRF